MLEHLTEITLVGTVAVSLASIVIAWRSYRSVGMKIAQIQKKMEEMGNSDVVEDESVPLDRAKSSRSSVLDEDNGE